ncbi:MULTISPECIES: dihydroneopterin triphosphate diphosphatase [unclassified Pseudoalteromonas]|uniref:dihydroneopterin triphosphate diphosphatase n=1 Tax=unclassified Pseudoalteromonas TaxID=194690 RepID=UPI002096E765|nr:dihydroneopterin triphosphate diphosphatase [Pseudoalteromonas sp. XMcav2-N]MCO7189585.1 dihydroneopterin triphosphate diphosphatase [Pseudoalteromonas sp. XMcav2-N]
MTLRLPHSVLVVIYTTHNEFLLLQRADDPGFWQSVTGGVDPGELPIETAYRELLEETGIDAKALGVTIKDHQKCNQYTIREQWRHRYVAGATVNTEYVFSVCVPSGCEVRLAPEEHLAYRWLTQQQAAEQAWSTSNSQEILAIERV